MKLADVVTDVPVASIAGVRQSESPMTRATVLGRCALAGVLALALETVGFWWTTGILVAGEPANKKKDPRYAGI